MLKRMTLLLLMISLGLAQDISITVTNQNLALVKEQRVLDLNEGLQNFSLDGVPGYIDPTSVHIKSADGSFEVWEQNFEYDLLNAGKILAKSVNSTITIIHPELGSVTGTLLFSDNQNAVLTTGNGELRIIPRSDEQQVIIENFDQQNNELVTKPTLVWYVNASKPGRKEAELSYLTRGISWNAEYVAVLNDNETGIDLSAWVSLDNKSGKTYRDARLKLMAGDLNLVQQNQFRGRQVYETMAMDVAAKAGFSEKEFFEYHLYTLERRTTIKDNQTKQVQLFEPAEVKVEKSFYYNPNSDPEKVSIIINFENSPKAGLGIPLPKGKVRIFKKDGKEMEFIGENLIDHTPKDEKVKIETGKAFDVRVERSMDERRKLGPRSEKVKTTVLIKNHKKENIEVLVEEPTISYREWRLVSSNFEPVEKKAGSVIFKVPVKAQEETQLEMEIQYNW